MKLCFLAEMNRRDLLRKAGGTIASKMIPGVGDVTKKIIDSIVNAPKGSPVAKIHDSVFRHMLTYVGVYNCSWEQAVDDQYDDEDTDEWLESIGVPKSEWRPDLVTPEMVGAYLKRLADNGDYGTLGWMIHDSSEYKKLFGKQIHDILSDLMKKLGGFPQLLRAINKASGIPMLSRIEVLKDIFPELNKLIPFDAQDATPEQIQKLEKILGKRFQGDLSYQNRKNKKRNKRWDDKNAHLYNEPWIRQDSESGMHQTFESRLNKALGLFEARKYDPDAERARLKPELNRTYKFGPS